LLREPSDFLEAGDFLGVMAGLVPATHAVGIASKAWVPATSAGMTMGKCKHHGEKH
jgi:hypothetical protein